MNEVVHVILQVLFIGYVLFVSCYILKMVYWMYKLLSNGDYMKLWNCGVVRKFKPVRPFKRTTHRSSTGKKLYAVRDKYGRFVDIQTYKKAHASDIKRSSKAERNKKKKR